MSAGVICVAVALAASGAVTGAWASTHPARHKRQTARPATFRVGAAVVEYTPPVFGVMKDDPANCLTAADAAYSGKRYFAFEEPYIDLAHAGHYELGDPFIDCNGDGRWDGDTLGGGGSSPRFYDHVADPVGARAIVISNGHQTVAMEVVDNEGLFNTYADRIRAAVAAAGIHLNNIQISSTHDESAPDTIGLGGVSEVVSGVNEYFASYLVQRSALAIERAYRAMRPAHIRYAQAQEPANFLTCWSSYPYIDNPAIPIMQAVGTNGKTIATLATVSMHDESLGFNGGPALDPGAPTPTTLNAENLWVSSDWVSWFRGALARDFGGVAIESAGSVGSVETPEVLSRAVTRVPVGHISDTHPAGCDTVFPTPKGAKEVPLGYYSETRAEGVDLAAAVRNALRRGAQWSHTNTIWADTVDICVPVQNDLFKAAAYAGTFGERTAYGPGCRVAFAPLPDGQTLGTSLLSAVAAWRIGDGEFIGVPGEVFPFTFLRGPIGPQDLNDPQYGMPDWPIPYMHTPWRFLIGLDNDMLGYIFPEGNDAGVPGAHPVHNPTASDVDRFGCGHYDDAESVSDQAANIIGAELVKILAEHARAPESVEQGRYVLADGALSRNPLSVTDSVGCSTNTTFSTRDGHAVAVWVPGRGVIRPARWMNLLGRPQAAPDRTTRGWFDPHGHRHWLNVFANIAGQPTTVALAHRSVLGPRGRLVR